MLSVIIPTLNAENTLPATLEALVPAAVTGLVSEVIVVDGGSNDATVRIADQAGCRIMSAQKGRGNQLAEGAKQARSPWLLFLHADTVLEDRWDEDVPNFIRDVEQGQKQTAAVFRFALGSRRIAARIIEFGVGLRYMLFAMPYGDQGLLVSRRLYDEVGGYAEMPIMEDVDMVRRLGRRRLVRLPSRALTNAARYEKDGFGRRVFRNLSCLLLYRLGVSPDSIQRRYG